MQLRRRATASIAALVPKSTWGRVIAASLAAMFVNDLTGRAFSFLLPSLSATLGETVRRLLPTAFVVGSIVLVLLAALLAVLAALDAKRPGMSRRDRWNVIWPIVVLLAGAGVGLVDARLSATSAQRVEASDR